MMFQNVWTCSQQQNNTHLVLISVEFVKGANINETTKSDAWD